MYLAFSKLFSNVCFFLMLCHNFSKTIKSQYPLANRWQCYRFEVDMCKAEICHFCFDFNQIEFVPPTKTNLFHCCHFAWCWFIFLLQSFYFIYNRRSQSYIIPRWWAGNQNTERERDESWLTKCQTAPSLSLMSFVCFAGLFVGTGSDRTAAAAPFVGASRRQ